MLELGNITAQKQPIDDFLYVIQMLLNAVNALEWANILDPEICMPKDTIQQTESSEIYDLDRVKREWDK